MLGYKEKFEQSSLWIHFTNSCLNEQNYIFLDEVKEACLSASELLKAVRDTFPTYTLHDSIHSNNMVHIISEMLGNKISDLSCIESAILVLSCFYHDIGMVYSFDEKRTLLENEMFQDFLNSNPKMYIEVQKTKQISDDIAEIFFRCIHHKRVAEKIPEMKYGYIPIHDYVALVCESHGYNVEDLVTDRRYSSLPAKLNLDLRFCAILIRLADILDFDNTRSPKSLYEYSSLYDYKNNNRLISNREWNKHISSLGFSFPEDRSSNYKLIFTACCTDINVEKNVRDFLDVIENELNQCISVLSYCNDRWRTFSLPYEIDRSSIISSGYEYGEFQFSIDKKQILNLFVGKNLYENPMVFIRELLQNSIDAVRTRCFLDDNMFEQGIKISTWIDDEGFYWFRIDDNGIGMNKSIIQNYFLKIGCSYYSSDEFNAKKIKRLFDSNRNFVPISRFGIGILSCFLIGDIIEISTKHYEEKEGIRLSINGLDNFYSVMLESCNHQRAIMPGRLSDERFVYRKRPGTSLAVRFNPYKAEDNINFESIIKKYVFYPEMPIYHNDILVCETESDLLEEIRKFEDICIELTDDQIKKICSIYSGLEFLERPKIEIKTILLENYTKSPDINGVLLICDVSYQTNSKPMEIADLIRVHFTDNKLIAEIRHPEADLYGRRPDRREKIQYERMKRQILIDIIEELKKHDIQLVIDKFNNVVSVDEEKNTKSDFTSGYDLDIYEELMDDEFESEDEETRKFEIIDVADLGIINKYFDLNAYYGGKKNTGHNGISLPDSLSLFGFIENSIILLKDNFRPDTNVARYETVKIPLNLAAEIEKICFLIKHETGIFVSSDSRYRVSDKITYFDLKQIILKSNEWDKLPLYIVEGEEMSISDLREKLKRKKEVRVELQENLVSHTYFVLYNIAFALLQINFSVVYSNEKIYINTTSYSKLTSSAMDLFRPLFFVSCREKTDGLIEFPHSVVLASEEIETAGTMKIQYSSDGMFFNFDHPFCIWLIENAMKLNELYPILFNNMIKALERYDAKTCQEDVNKLLDNLNSIKNCQIIVPKDIYLSDSNFTDFRFTNISWNDIPKEIKLKC